ncbi:HlyD family secretion protein [Sulfurospirillum diekertiae]|uniref:HlyD family efflux transporter periplasmic adaptor subunit n=1 Tax=Sulfurospirillum diekertiae TaxID=1854492 RepID=A0AA92IZK6_9BACT|nr:HlyD family efflux transporter periplasmic adaptor subunit [Sulfurospirillum diekertiae]QIR77189.1 HlyD family efflux transporter periplasmic adaptor subunit [Sulfurospirillum diekertiae]
MLEKLKQYRLGVAILALVLIASGLIIHKLIAPTLAANLVQGSGRMDGDLINLNAKYAGRISTLNIQEGQHVELGQNIAVLASEEYEAQKAQIEAQISARTQELNAKETELEIASKTIPETLSKAKDNLSIKQHQRTELDKNIASQTSILAQDKHDLERMKNLFEHNLIEKRQVETAVLKFQTSGDLLAGLQQKREQLSLAINVANSELIEATAHQKTLRALEQGIEALKSSLKALEASKTQIEAILHEMILRSSVNGVVVEKIANQGEVIGAGSVVATLLDPNSLYLKIFVDTKQNGNLQVGNDAVIFLDGKPNEPIQAKVVRIEQKAEFTPKEVSVPSDRIQRVFALHVKPLSPQPTLKLGIPAVGVVSMDGKGLPKSLNNVPE